jgi:hypothetical protein
MTPWIDVKNGLPPINAEILAYAKEFGSDKYIIIKAIYYDRYEIKGRKPDYQFYECCHCSGYECDDMNIENVSHWMPLPSTESIEKKT